MGDSKSEISLAESMLLAVFMGVLFLALAYKNAPIANFEAMKTVLASAPIFWILAILIPIINVCWVLGLIARQVGLSGQGSRLRTLSAEAKGRTSIAEAFSKKGIFYGFTIALPFSLMRLPTVDWVLENRLEITLLLLLNFGLLGSLFFKRASAIYQVIKGKYSDAIELPPFPERGNSLVLGSINEGSSKISPEWLTIDRKALNTGILITGSIGSGKTQGAVFPYFVQAMQNLKPHPSALILDPKRRFVQEAKTVVERLGFASKTRVISLEGSESFNPVYVDGILKDAKFLDVADMLRASALNFSGGANESPFWEISGFNLIKNAIVYCASVKGYFTLTDIYSSMVQASHLDLADAMRLKLNSADCRFNDEERYNVACAIQYFDDEFRSLDDRVRTGIVATSTSFLNQFQEYKAAKIFCPSKDKRTIVSMDQIVDNGEILLLDIESPALARSIGTIIKLHYEASILNRLSNPLRSTERPALLMCDEYQDIVTCGGGHAIGDDRFQAKCREANAIFIAAAQSLSSIMNTVGKEKAVRELIQNFRTRIAFHSSDTATIKDFQELAGQREFERASHSLTEIAQSPTRNLVLGGFDTSSANISESVSISTQKEFEVTGREFNKLETFECYSLVFDGDRTTFQKLYMKPFYLRNKATLHKDIVPGQKIRKRLGFAFATACLALNLASFEVNAFPSICEIIKQPQFRECLGWTVTPTTCGFPPHPCAQISYFVPQTFLETTTSAGLSHFSDYPGAANQLASIPKMAFGAVDDEDSQSFHARSISVPYASIVLAGLPCGGTRMPKFCFDAMSEHFGEHWKTGSGDLFQPAFLAWQASPKLCLLKGAVGEISTSVSSDSPMCSIRMLKTTFPPSQMPVCTPWGVMFPRYGTIVGASEIIGSLAMAERIKSLSVEILRSAPSTPGEKWQLISPNSSMCFREFEHIASLESIKLVNNRSRMIGKDLTGNLVATWKRVSCVREYPEVPFYEAQLAMLQSVCQGMK